MTLPRRRRFPLRPATDHPPRRTTLVLQIGALPGAVDPDAPTCTVAWDQDTWTIGTDAGAASFTVSDAEVGTLMRWRILGTALAGSLIVGSPTVQVSGLDLSGVAPGAVEVQVTLTRGARTGPVAADVAALVAPTGTADLVLWLDDGRVAWSFDAGQAWQHSTLAGDYPQTLEGLWDGPVLYFGGTSDTSRGYYVAGASPWPGDTHYWLSSDGVTVEGRDDKRFENGVIMSPSYALAGEDEVQYEAAIYRTEDFSGWVHIGTIDGPDLWGQNAFPVLAFARDDNDLWAVSGYFAIRVARSTDGGESWVATNRPVTQTSLGGGLFSHYTLGLLPGDDNRIYYCIDALVNSRQEVWYSDSDGANWTLGGTIADDAGTWQFAAFEWTVLAYDAQFNFGGDPNVVRYALSTDRGESFAAVESVSYGGQDLVLLDGASARFVPAAGAWLIPVVAEDAEDPNFQTLYFMLRVNLDGSHELLPVDAGPAPYPEDWWAYAGKLFGPGAPVAPGAEDSP